MKLYTEEQVRDLLDKMDVVYSLDELTPIELPSYKEQLDRIEELLLSEEIAKRNRFKIGPL